jgi:hypothetical protein
MTVAGRYLVGAPIGVGGHGMVHRATHLTLDLPVAVKVLAVGTMSAAERAQLTERFAREARTVACIRHRNVLSIHDAGLLSDGSPYLVTELIDGEDLEQRIERGPLSIPAVVDLGRQLFSALTAIAAGGVLHRDVKPANVMLHHESDGQVHVKLIDFGIAHADRETARLTVTGQIMGTPHYMAPEQLRGEKLDVRVDLYAASAVLYEAVTGAPPFDGASAPLVIGGILAGDLRSILAIRPDCPIELAMLIERGLSRAPAARPSHPLEVVNELGALAQRLGLPTGPLAWAHGEPSGATSPISSIRMRATPIAPARTTASARVADDVDGSIAAITATPASVPTVTLGAARLGPRLAVGLTVTAIAASVGLWLTLGGPARPELTVVAPVTASFVAPSVSPVAIDVAPTLRLGLEALARGETDRALESYRAACVADPDSPEAQRGRGLAASGAGLDDEAVAAFERYLALAPDATDGARVRERLRGLRRRRGASARHDRH